MFKKVDPKQSFPQLEQAVLTYWKENGIFQKSIDQRDAEKAYVFYDGPPFATGLPHYGHILAGTMKDVVPRYWTMRGHRVERRFGWDCHGLPVENLVEKELGVQGKKEIEEKLGVAKFNEACRDSVLKYTAEWEQTVERMGRWVDFKNDYKTMDPDYMESIWWVFKQLWDKELIYQGKKSMHVCPRCVTPLSNFEVTLGYKDVKDHSVIWKFKVKGTENTYLLAWTTTPWSTLSTMGLAVGPEHTYVKVRVNDEELIFVKDRLEFVMQGFEEDQYEVVEEFKGEALVGTDYQPIADFYLEVPEVANSDRVYKVYGTDYVEVEEGTGLVTINGAYGEIDMEAAKANDLPILLDVGMDGEFTELSGKYAGMYVKDAESVLIKDMLAAGMIWRTEKYKHSYPHCWRCDTPLLNYATKSWFVSVEKIKDKMLAANEQIHWVPEHLKYGRFGKWLENARDWAISRNRFWGAPLPVWISEDGEDMICVGSREELHQLSGVMVDDLHKHFVDEVTFEKDGKTYRRTEEVLDCWFESGAMPYAQNHYPFENKDWFDQNFPAQFIAEGLDQTRGWFYTLVVLGAALFEKPPFKNVIVNGLVLAEDGKKMSKRLKNYPDPNHIFDSYGADALRFYLMNSPVVKAEVLRFSEKGVADVVRNIMLPLWNAYSFFVTYANIDQWTVDRYVEEKENRLDRWVISELEQLLNELTQELDSYDLQRATEPIAKFIDSLTNWYIRRSRRRFWKSENDGDKDQAYSTLFYVLKRLSLILAPFMPFMSEEIYRNLTSQESVHLADWPAFDAEKIDLDLNREMGLVQQIVSLGLAIRAQQKLKVRQPLQKVELVGVKLADGGCGEHSHCIKETDIQIIKEELNVKEVVFLENFEEIATRVAKPIGSMIGKKYGAEVQHIIKAAKSGDFVDGEEGTIVVAGKWKLEPTEFEFHYEGKSGSFVAAESYVVVALDGNVTPELKAEGVARDVVRSIQSLRKKAEFNVDDRIEVSFDFQEAAEVKLAVEAHLEYVKAETLATAVNFGLDGEFDLKEEVKIGGCAMVVAVKKV